MNSLCVNQSFAETKNSFYQPNTMLSEISFSRNIMIRERLPSTFKSQFWDQISKCQPDQFLLKQTRILQAMLIDEDKFITHFNQFYQNHRKIYNWYALANQKHNQIKEYIFSRLLKKPIPDYKVECRNNMAKKTKKLLTKEDKSFIQSKNYITSSKNSPRKKSAPQEKTGRSFMHKSVALLNQQQNPAENYYDLFMKTLEACEGSKYIHYDFRKHQKGIQSKSLYNNFIRCKNSDKQNQNQQQKLFQKIIGFKQNPTSSHSKLLQTKMVSVFKQKKANLSSHESLSAFEMKFLVDQKEQQINTQESRGFSKKYAKRLVLKKMPHRFGNPKHSIQL